MRKESLIILPSYNQRAFIKKHLPGCIATGSDILIIYDGSTDDTFEGIKNIPSVRCIRHEKHIGYGAAFVTGCEYARDFDYQYIIALDHTVTRCNDEVKLIREQLNYGYDIVNISRILENPSHDSFSPEDIRIVSTIAAALKDITSFDLTDPLSGIKGLRTEAFRSLQLTETSHGVFLQMWVQARYYDMAVIEIPSSSASGFAQELALYDYPLEQFLALLETEKYLYPPPPCENNTVPS